MHWGKVPPPPWRMLLVGILAALLVVALGAVLAHAGPEWLDTVTATAAALATVTVVGLTYLNLHLARRMVWHFRETREGQFRPYMTARWLPRVAGGHAAIEVELVGMAAARNVTLGVSPPALRTPAGDPLRSLPLLRYGLETLPQGIVLLIPVDPGSVDPDVPVRVELAYDDFYVPPRDFRETFSFLPAAFEGVAVRRPAGDG